MRTLELIHSLKKYTLLAVVLSCVPQLRAQWTAVVGAQSPDQARQALALLPNEMWIHADEFLDLSGRGITVDPHNHTTVYFADRGSSIWRSLYAGAAGAGALKSTDGGASFSPKNSSLPGLPAGIRTSRTGSVQVDPNRHNVLYVGTEGAGVVERFKRRL